MWTRLLFKTQKHFEDNKSNKVKILVYFNNGQVEGGSHITNADIKLCYEISNENKVNKLIKEHTGYFCRVLGN